MLISTRIILVFLLFIIKDAMQIQNVKLILPTVVQAGTSATLLCLYDLEGASLYSVQWYRGQFEFFRFVPKETPQIKVFHLPGLNVDTFASNDHQVTLTNIPVQLSGKFSCEITTDAPPFSTSCVSENLKIVDFQLNLDVPKKQFYFGDIIDASCTLTPDYPSAKFVFHWNSKTISEKHVQNDRLQSAVLHLNSTVYSTGQTFPVLVQLSCSAILNGMQHSITKTISLKLKSTAAVPKSTAAHSSVSFFSPIFLILMLALLH